MRKLCKTEIDKDLWLYYLKDDKYIGQRVALKKYEEYETKLLINQLKLGDTVVDVGANLGFISLLAAKKVGDKGKVIAFEPDPVNFEILKKNIDTNKIKNIYAYNLAVSDKEGLGKLFLSQDNLGDHRAYESNEERKSVEMKSVKLDDFLSKEKRIDLIKTDTQGYEPKVIRGARKTIEKFRPIIFMEYWPYGYKMAKTSFKAEWRFLKNIYEKIFWIDEYLYYHQEADLKLLKRKSEEKIKNGHTNIWMKKNYGWHERFLAYKNFRIKKLIKKILFKAGLVRVII